MRKLAATDLNIGRMVSGKNFEAIFHLVHFRTIIFAPSFSIIFARFAEVVIGLRKRDKVNIVETF